MILWLTILYLLAAAGLTLYAVWGLLTLYYYGKTRDRRPPTANRPSPCHPVTWSPCHLVTLSPGHPVTWSSLPPITVQLPLYNEARALPGLLAAMCRLEYPRDRLQIQLLDDSTDETTALAAALVAHYQGQGHDISLHHRPHRQGFKAGALNAALPQASGDFLAIFDADFRPPPDFLRRAALPFLAEPRLGLVQARWTHLNAGASALTAAQALALDKHFVIDQAARFGADLFPRFNGTAGVWRRACIEDAGGWHGDTACEDVCLSTRAVLRGWACHYLPELTAPAEVPATVTAYKQQQARWAQGATQCLLKYGRAIATTRRQRPIARLHALLSLSAYFAGPLFLLTVLLQIPLLALNVVLPRWLLLPAAAGVVQPLLFALAQRALYGDWRRRLRHLPALLLLAAGLSPAISRAVLAALLRRPFTFERTPKSGEWGLGDGGWAIGDGRNAASSFIPHPSSLRPGFDWMIGVEVALAVYAAGGVGLALVQGHYGPLPLLLTAAVGAALVGLAGLGEWRGGWVYGNRR